MRSRRRSFPIAVAVALAAVVLGGCDSGTREDGVSGDGATTEAPPLSVSIPPERLTPFCQAMIDLGDRLVNDPPPDPASEIIAVYESLVDVVPPEIEVDFLTVLARLQSGAPATTSTTITTTTSTTVAGVATVATTLFAEEGYDPDEDPALRVNQYVQFTCRDAVNNPGPAATQPGETAAP
jgi:hypothetical protein